MWPERAIARAAALACRLEAAAHKPGNVTPTHAFPEMGYEDFLKSAEAIAPPMGEAGRRSVGETVLLAVEATRRATRANTNLGTILLLAPLARAAAGAAESRSSGWRSRGFSAGLRGGDSPEARGWRAGDGGAARERQRVLRSAVKGVLAELDLQDAELAYRAMRLARPGGMGRLSHQDLGERPTVTLLEAMRLAADRDLVAREYATAFDITFANGLPLLEECLSAGLPLPQATVDLFMEILGRFPDTLVARKFGPAAAEETSARAAAAVAVATRGSPERSRELARFDGWLRHPSRRWNPGTIADLVAATLFTWLLTTAEPEDLLSDHAAASWTRPTAAEVREETG